MRRTQVERIRENDATSPTPAVTHGLTACPLSSGDVLLRRCSPTLVALPRPLESWYWRDVPTRQVTSGTRHRLQRAA